MNRLTPRQEQVFERIGRGRTYPQIARDLGISRKTVEAHVAHLKEAYGVSGRHELIVMAVEVRVRREIEAGR